MQNQPLPKWAEDAIDQLRQVEIVLGHLPKGDSHLSTRLKQLMDKLESEAAITEETSEFLFRRIARGLHSAGLSAEEIADAINRVVNYPGGPKYCDSSEVSDAL